MIDYTKIESTPAEPEASSMIETFRAIGYSIEAAVADIIDNSISAGAKNIWIDYLWDGPETLFSITDDGQGMTSAEIVQSMKPGSMSPLTERSTNDLGRFGLGLKTASFSQCRKFCVISKASTALTDYWAWDLDFVTNHAKAWKLIKYCPKYSSFEERVNQLSSGTAVVWWDVDRLTSNTTSASESSKAKFLATMEGVKKHLSMVFHRYMEDGLSIFFKGRKIDIWDPFMIGHDGLQPKPEVPLENGKVAIKGFILPHRSKLSAEDYNYGKGPKDSWTAHQGFYVYRNKRLLVAGDWLGLFKREVHYDLCRIRIDLPNNMDSEWQIDIKKSVARPPARFRDQIEAVAKEARTQALEVYRHKGKILKRKLGADEYYPFWEERIRHGKRFYKLNRNHPLLKELFQANGNSSQIERVLQFIEETVPVPLITLQENENEQPHGQPFEGMDHSAIKETMQKLFTSLTSEGVPVDRVKSRILNTEPFNFFPEYLDSLCYE